MQFISRARCVSVSASGLIATTLMAGCGGGAAPGNGTTGGSNAPSLTLASFPATLTEYPSTTFPVSVKAYEMGTTTTPTITLGTLPAGITTTSSFPMSVPLSGATITFTVASTAAAGSYVVPISGKADSATATAAINLQVSSGTPSGVTLSGPASFEVGIVQGGSSTLKINTSSSSYYDVSLNATGLPPGVTASVVPQVLVAGNQFTVTLSAASNAQVAQNILWKLTATPAANVPPVSLDFLLDVTPPSGIGWTNRTAYTSTRTTPFSGVYDPVHQLIYSSNVAWNRIDVVSNITHSLQQSISIRDPREMDISIDGSTIWVATGSQVMYGIDTTTLKATRYLLPGLVTATSNAAGSWGGGQVFSLADGTVMVGAPFLGGLGYFVIWSPGTNSLAQMPAPAAWGTVARSGDGKHIFSMGSDELETSFTYDVLSQTFSAPVSLSSFGYANKVAANTDGSRIAVTTLGLNPFSLYDGELNLIGNLPGDGGDNPYVADNLIFGGFVFSQDGKTLYEETGATGIPAIIGIDVSTQQLVALAPAMPVLPPLTHLVNSYPYYIPVPFAVDNTGIVLGIQYHGIAFDDSAAKLNFFPNAFQTPVFMNDLSVYSGPLQGGTTSEVGTGELSLLPDVYFGSAKGTATLSNGTPEITPPPSSVPGPVDVKMLSPDGIEIFDPQFFTYGTQIQDAIISGAGPDGGAAATLDAFGLPLNPSQNLVLVGGNAATVTSKTSQYPPFTGEQTDMFLSYTVPAGSPGRADLTVANPNGTGKLAKAFLYAQSVTDYPTSDSPSFVLFDGGRNKLYLSAGSHIDVFSLSSRSFASPLNSPVNGSQFEGLALTPDGKSLLAADLTTGALAVFNPDTPSTSYEISIPGSVPSLTQCPTGPLFVAPDNQGNALVVSGKVIGISCGPGGPLFIANLASKTSSKFAAPGCGPQFGSTAANLKGTLDGSLVAFNNGVNIYLPSLHSCVPAAQPDWQFSLAVAGDGNTLAVDRTFFDPQGNIVGKFAFPQVLYPLAVYANYTNFDPYVFGGTALQNPQLNDAGSLYYWPYPGYIDIIDVQHGTPTLRFALTETVTNTVAPMAIDSGGQHIYLITNKGLTIVDLGNAPLSIGHLSQTTASAGAQIVLRGSGFQNGIAAAVGGQPAGVVYKDTETLTLTVPSANPGLEDILLTNPDGTTYTLGNAITIH